MPHPDNPSCSTGMTKTSPAVAFTIGHSTRRLEDLIELLRAHSVATLIDVRTMPRSRHNPQFNADSLAAALEEAGIGYEHAPDLGGFRRPKVDSPNSAWRNTSFRGYADYMQTDQFAAALQALVGMSHQGRLAIMCAEALLWRCHRSLVADALNIRGIPVVEILSEEDYRMHQLTSFACVEGLQITYPPEQATLL